VTGVPGVVDENIGLFDLPATLTVEDRTGLAPDRSGASIDLVSSPPKLIALDVGDVLIVVDKEYACHRSASFVRAALERAPSQCRPEPSRRSEGRR
jgi:hypothetical protein